MQKVLLLNPPGRLRYIRDQFCSHVSKGSYYWQPLDLLLLSGTLGADGYELAVVDAIAERLGPDAARRRIDAFGPACVVFLTGSDSFQEDVRFVEGLKAGGSRTVVGIGDILRGQGVRALDEHPVIDACLNEFVTHGLSSFLEGHLDRAEGMTVRTSSGPRTVLVSGRSNTFTLPSPRYGLFPLDRYRLPFNRFHPYATIITSTGCPYACSFCPFARTPYRVRQVDDVLANLEAIRDMGIRQVHIADWTFGVNRAHAMSILERMIERDFRFAWSCLSRVDLVDREMLALLKRAGCELVEFGVESGSQAILDRCGKRITLEQIRQAFAWARDLRLSTLATFVLGLPGETRGSLEETLRLALEIEPSYCSFNVASPRMGSRLRQEMLDAGLIAAAKPARLDSSWAVPAFSTPELPASELHAFRRHAIRRFYGRPGYLLRRLAGVGSWTALRHQLANGAALAWQTVRVSGGGPNPAATLAGHAPGSNPRAPSGCEPERTS